MLYDQRPVFTLMDIVGIKLMNTDFIISESIYIGKNTFETQDNLIQIGDSSQSGQFYKVGTNDFNLIKPKAESLKLYECSFILSS